MTADDDDNDRTVVRAGAAGALRPGAGAAPPVLPAHDAAHDPQRMAPTLPAEGAGAAAIAEAAAVAAVAALAVDASSRAAAGDELPLGTRLGEFEISALVGQGGFGIVYEAIDHSLGRRVALKEYMPSALAARNANAQVQVRSERYRETFEAGRKSFVNEARLLASFDHPALVKVYRFWEGNGTAYMAMQFLEGRTLQEMLRESRHAGLPPPDEAWLRSVLAPLTEALLVIHAQQCYHRDIAPDNVMQLANGRWLLLDFGAARRVIGDMTQALTVILKPGYAPIEQYAEAPGMKQGPWTDVYALAAVVYYAIVGKTPPPSVSRMLEDDYVPLAQAMAGRYSDAFLSAIDRALAVRPEQRTQSIDELRRQLGLGEPTIDPFLTQPLAPAQTGVSAPAPPAAPLVAALPAASPAASHAAQPSAPPALQAPPPSAPPSSAPAPAAAAPDALARRRTGVLLGRRTGVLVGVGTAVVILSATGIGTYSLMQRGRGAPAPQAETAQVAAPAPTPPLAAAVPAAEPTPAAAPAAAPAPFDVLHEFERVVAAQTSGFAVSARAPKTALRIDKDEFRFDVTSERGGYLTVLGLGSDGEVARLVPNKLSGVVRLKPGQTWRFPARDRFALDARDPPGPTYLLMVVAASPRSFDALRPAAAGNVLVFPEHGALQRLVAGYGGAQPALAGRAQCAGGAACPPEYGAALLRFDTQR